VFCFVRYLASAIEKTLNESQSARETLTNHLPHHPHRVLRAGITQPPEQPHPRPCDLWNKLLGTVLEREFGGADTISAAAGTMKIDGI
jgi:hypothetical protein